MWCKMSNLELGTRVPLIFRAPVSTPFRSELLPLSSGRTLAGSQDPPKNLPLFACCLPALSPKL